MMGFTAQELLANIVGKVSSHAGKSVVKTVSKIKTTFYVIKYEI